MKLDRADIAKIREDRLNKAIKAADLFLRASIELGLNRDADGSISKSPKASSVTKKRSMDLIIAVAELRKYL